MVENSRALLGGCHVAVGTPGRVRFLMSKGLLRPWSARTLVLDSADWLMAPIFQVWLWDFVGFNFRVKLFV